MAVMKTCCGCFSTKSGTFAVLLLYTAAYIACIVGLSINIGGDNYQKWYKESVLDNNEWRRECDGAENMKLWKCETSFDLQYEIKNIFIGIITACCIFFVVIVIAIIGTAKDKHWPLLPWIIIEFIRLFTKVALLVLVIILWAVNMKENADTSNLIATSVIGSVILAFYFYVWLCVVSHFQTLKEINNLGLLDKGANGAVLPFVNEDGLSNTSTVNSTVNMRENDDENPNDPDENKDELESVADSTKDDDDETTSDDEDKTDRPTSASSKIEADTLIDAETNE